MAPTKRLYYRDSYLTKVATQVVAASDDRLRITLDQTSFYPTSGGQPHDSGTLNGIEVVDVIDEGETITHVLAAPLIDLTVQGEISWVRRYDHMQQHSGQHLLSAVFEQVLHIPTVSFRMGDEISTIELGARELSQHQMDSVVQRANELARANPRIVITFEDAAEAQGLRKTSEREGTLRIIEIPGIDRSACGGTHVATLAEVLPLQIRDIDRVRGNVRISFICGDRAIAQSKKDFQTLASVAQSLTAAPELIGSQVLALKQRLAAAEKQNQRLESEAAARAGVDLYGATIPGEGDIRRVVLAVSAIDENHRTKVKAFAAQPKAILLMHSKDGLLLACSPDAGINAGAALKEALAKTGARGGGSPTLAQGSLTDQSILDELKQKLGLSS